MTLNATIVQRRGQDVVRGTGSTEVRCTGTDQVVEMFVRTDGSQFKPGWVLVDVVASPCLTQPCGIQKALKGTPMHLINNTG